ncbi:MAG: hypothetical protein M1827_003832 [Pycnora praestabilis]|nr:MAG: hypothetical protein M1827_003832 [Pycnora praestabilis]
MTDITALLNEALKRHEVSTTTIPRSRSQNIDEFLKEAYRINSHIVSLHAYLRSIKQSYLSTSLPPRRTQLSRTNSSSTNPPPELPRKYLTDAQRDQIDAESKQLLRELNASIRQLSDAEQLRRDTESTLAKRKHARSGLGILGRWAAGGVGLSKTPEEEREEARTNGVKVHRESVLWYLRRKLEECSEVQRSMMEARLAREIEKSKSILYKSGVGSNRVSQDLSGISERSAGFGGNGVDSSATGYVGGNAAQMDEMESQEIEQRLSPEQLQMFEKENQDMLKHYEGTLDQVKTAERSLVEISELQTTLANNLVTQSAHIDQLVADTFYTAENVGGGNQQLKKATERKSTAKYVFYVSCGFSLFLVAWDLLI